jgi:3-methylcrotonyl-CoA carboxylase alpha subunit
MNGARFTKIFSARPFSSVSLSPETALPRNDVGGLSRIHKLLIANRGEIACRIITTAKRMGIPTVAVYSDADRSALHVAMADEAICIGPPPATESYLRQDRVIEAAKVTGASAIHPGYGFLSENSSFAASCEAAGLTFVGPPASAMRAMADKSEAKALMSAAGVPVVPGYHGRQQDEVTLSRAASEIGYPLLVKAVMGGGGMGMKLANNDGEFLEALSSARREALAAFGDDRVLLERYVQAPRHIEVQIMADTHGNTFHLAERDCSVQRRHQKVLEEAPAPGVSPSFRAALGASAVAAAVAVGYRSAGTVEFIVDSRTKEHFFMEMNTRLQVEHPVTEGITGLDLVELQLHVAGGGDLRELLGVEGEGQATSFLEPKYHAIEARLYAENPENNFLPGGGRLERWRIPPRASRFTFFTSQVLTSMHPKNHGSSSSVRIDSGVIEGDSVGVFYDPMIAKAIAKAPTRTAALDALSGLLSDLQVAGMPTNTYFVQKILCNDEFRAGAVDTSFIERHLEKLLESEVRDVQALDRLSALALCLFHTGLMSKEGYGKGATKRNVYINDSFRVNHDLEAWTSCIHAGTPLLGTIKHESERSASSSPTKRMLVSMAAKSRPLEVKLLEIREDVVIAEIDGRRESVSLCYYVHPSGEEEILELWPPETQRDLGVQQFKRPIVNDWGRSVAYGGDDGVSRVTSPMPGRVVKVFVKLGESIVRGQRICAVEAMKMEHAVKADRDGTVSELHAFEGSQVQEGQVLALVGDASKEI